MNKKEEIKLLFESLLQSKDTFTEGFSDNDGKRDGKWLEDNLREKFTNIVKDYSEERRQIHPDYEKDHDLYTEGFTKKGKTKKIYDHKLDFICFGNFPTKGARTEYFKKFTKAIKEENTKEAIQMLKPASGFIEQPCSSKRQPDMLIWWTNEDGSKGWLEIDVKTGGGTAPKLNDKGLGPDHVVIFNSRNKKVAHRPFHICFVRDLDFLEDTKVVEEAKKLYLEFKATVLDPFQKDNKKLVYDPRHRVNNKIPNWFVTIDNITREQREQEVIDFLS